MGETTIGGNIYRIGKLAAREQLHVYRRLAPVLQGAGGIEAFMGMAAAAKPTDGAPIDPAVIAAIGGLLGPMLNILGALPDHEIDYVIDLCLAKVGRKVDGDRGYAPVFNGGLMFDDISVWQMLELTGRVIIGDPGTGGIADFLDALPSISAGGDSVKPA